MTFFSAVQAFVFAFMYHSLWEYLFSNADTRPVALLFITAFPLLAAVCTLIPNKLVESVVAGFVERYISVIPDAVFDYLLGDFVAACEDRVVIPAPPAPAPVPPPVQLHTIPLSVVLEVLSRPTPVSPPPPVKLEAVDILPAWYPASFPLPTPPPPPPPSTLRWRTVKLCCLP